ncbi:hypothetical protein [Nocardiopsis sp. M1B1]|uniref:hypothetical protein n=1 Tax=Nocardiopsis sp. M1B1 TaxID=3450454 RepID=UPI004038FE6C
MNKVYNGVSSLIRRVVGPDDAPEPTTFRWVEFLQKRWWLLLVLAAVVGFAAGLASGFLVFRRDESPHPTLGLFVTPVVLLGYAAARPGQAAWAGLAALLFAVLGDFVGVRYTLPEHDLLLYRTWFVFALCIGPSLGVLGYLIRARWKVVRAAATGVVTALVLVPFYYRFEGDEFLVDSMTPYTMVFDAASIAVFLILCRGVLSRVAAVLLAYLLVWGIRLMPLLYLWFLFLLWAFGEGA